MCKGDHRMVDLGFTKTLMPPGTHICQIYDDCDERNDSLLQFLACGLRAKEKNACFSENVTDEMLDDYMSGQNIPLQEAVSSGAFTHAGTTEVYFEDNRFDPDRMVSLLAAFYDTSVKEGYADARVIGEMSSAIEKIDGGSRLLEYESKVSILLRDHPITTVCQYKADDFDGATIMDVLKVHPMMIVRGNVVNNPFFIEPEQVLAGNI